MLPLRQRRRVVWVAVFAILLNALAPAMAQTFAARLGVAWLEICTAGGLKRTAVQYEGARPDLPPGAHLVFTEHCSFCAPHGAQDMHAPPRGSFVAVVGGPARVDTAVPDSAPQRADSSSGDARAPPALS